MEIRTIHSAGGVVVNEFDEVIVVQQRNNTWSLPKGHIETGEDAETAARREIQEESGARDLEFVKAFSPYTRGTMLGANGAEDMSRQKTLHFFHFKTKKVPLAPEDPDNPEARWVHKSEVAYLLTNPKDQVFFESILGEI